MSTLHNHASNISNSLNNNSSSSSSNTQQSPHSGAPSSVSATGGQPFFLGTATAPTTPAGLQQQNNINNNHHACHPSDSTSTGNIINNNHHHHHHSHTTPGGGGSGGGGVGGILGVRDVGAKKFLPSFARSMMMSSSSHQAAAAAASSSGASSALTDSAASATADCATLTSGGAAVSGMLPFAAGRSTSSSSGMAAAASSFPIPQALGVELHGYQRKLKTNKKKYFVVYGDTPDKFARLEYYDNEKKFKQVCAKGGGGGEGPAAKRSIVLRSCFNINKRHDTKKHIISLFTKDDCFCIVFETEDELNWWLRTLLRLQRGEESEGEPPRPTFEHVWDVFVQRKGLGDSYGILGNYRLCITDKILSLIRIAPDQAAAQDKRADVVEFSLASIRRCGHSQRYFYLEVGRSSKTGAGEIWMEVQDSIIAQNMYTTIMKSAKSKDDNLGPMIRIRSSSANAASKPTSMLFRRQTHAGQKPMNCSPSSGAAIARERCDSLPSRNRTTSETMPHQQQQQQQQLLVQHHLQQHQLMLNSGGSSMPPPRMIPSNNRPHSMHISSCHGHSPPVNSSPLSPPPANTNTATYSTGSDGSSYSIDESTDSFITDPPTPDEGNGYKVINHLNSGGSIPEENSEEFIKDYGHIDLGLGGGLSQHDEYGVQGTRRGGSPAPPSTVGSVEGSAYMEMCSPSGSSPGDPSGSCYMAMSPVADYSRGLCSSSSAHSRASSLAEDLVDGYVPMSMPRSAASSAATVAPPAPEEYVVMDPTQNGTSSRLSNANSGVAGHIGGMSSAASSCSITSGTPSTDLRLSLEKVPAYIGQSDESEMNDRPYRTYSVGSRPEHIKRKLRIDMLSSAEGSGGLGGGAGGGSASSRQRAFSVGSRAKVPRCSEMYKGYSAAPVIVSFVSSSSQGSVTESNNNSSGSTSSIPNASGSFGAANLPVDECGIGAMGMGKSGSGQSLVGDGKPPSHGSFDRMGDLMEIDYSSPRQSNASSTPLKKPSHDSTSSAGGGASVIPGMEDYLDMSGGITVSGYGHNLNNNNNDDDRRAAAAAHAVAGYVEMRPGRLDSQSEEGDYLNMTPAGGATHEDVPDGPVGSAKSTSNPIQICSPKKYNSVSMDTTTSGATGSGVAGTSGGAGGGSSSAGKNNNYLDMYPRMLAKATAPSTSRAGAMKAPSEDYLNMTPLMMSSVDSGSEEKMLHGDDEDIAGRGASGGAPEAIESTSAPDGYMEMSWNHTNNTTANSSAVSSMMPPSDDYMNMSFGGGGGSSQPAPSAPITIQPAAGKCRLDLSGESKVEASTNIPNYLPLGQYHTVEPRKGAHTDATTIVSLQQPVQTTTGQQSGWVGFSPSKTGGAAAGGVVLRARCDSRDSGIVTPSGSQATIFPFSPGSPTKPFPALAPKAQDEIALADAADASEMAARSAAGGGVETLEDLSQNYAELSLGRQQSLGGQVVTALPSSDAPATTTRKLSTGSRSSGTFGKATLASPGIVQPDYVNFCPAGPTTPIAEVPAPQLTSVGRSRVEDDGAGDYALMNPASARKQSTTSMGASGSGGSVAAGGNSPASVGCGAVGAPGSTTPPVLVTKKSHFLSNPQMGFKPITSAQDSELMMLGQVSPFQGGGSKVHGCTASSPKANFSRRLDGVSTAFTFDQQQYPQQQPPLQRSFSGTRPSSVNSELISVGRGGVGGVTMGTGTGASTPTSSIGTTRPNSANSERLPIISATSSSASSTSTLCESKNQSPSASCTAIGPVDARPDSVSSLTDPFNISRPPSVSSERELHYASLDLPPCTKTRIAPAAPLTEVATAAVIAAAIATAPSTPSSAVQKMDVDEPMPGSNEARYLFETMSASSTSSPSPNSSGCTSQQQQLLLQQQQQLARYGGGSNYAKIDFMLSQAPNQQHQQHPKGGPPAPGSGSGGVSGTPQSSQA